jgi:hypothetical protein
MSAKEHKASMLFKVIFHFTKKFSCRLRIHDLFQTINNNYNAEIIFKIPVGSKLNSLFMFPFVYISFTYQQCSKPGTFSC